MLLGQFKSKCFSSIQGGCLGDKTKKSKKIKVHGFMSFADKSMERIVERRGKGRVKGASSLLLLWAIH